MERRCPTGVRGRALGQGGLPGGGKIFRASCFFFDTSAGPSPLHEYIKPNSPSQGWPGTPQGVPGFLVSGAWLDRRTPTRLGAPGSFGGRCRPSGLQPIELRVESSRSLARVLCSITRMTSSLGALER